MKRYYKEEDGTKKWFKNTVVLDGMQVINPTEEQILAAGYVEYVPPTPAEPTEEELLEAERGRLMQRIRDYDESRAVNVCYIVWQGQTIPYWADKNERATLEHAVQKYMSAGNLTYRLDLREVGVAVEIPCESLLQMMATLEVYAVQCYNKTTDHLFAAKQLATEDEMKAYDHTVGYPEIPTFEL